MTIWDLYNYALVLTITSNDLPNLSASTVQNLYRIRFCLNLSLAELLVYDKYVNSYNLRIYGST